MRHLAQKVSLAPTEGRAGSGPASPRDWRPAAPPGLARPKGGAGHAERLTSLPSSPGPGSRGETPHFRVPLAPPARRPRPGRNCRQSETPGPGGFPASAVGSDFLKLSAKSWLPFPTRLRKTRGGGVRRERGLGFSFPRPRGARGRK